MSQPNLENVYRRIEALKTELKEQRATTQSPGNPYISALGGKIAGAEEVLDIPLVKAAPEMFEELERLIAFIHGYGIFDKNGVSHIEDIELDRAELVLAKARGETWDLEDEVKA